MVFDGALCLQFKRGAVDFLVATDALARGIDIGEIGHVVSYDCPLFVKTYIHRVGRTARAGKTGTAITLVDKSENKKFNSIMKEAGKTDRYGRLANFSAYLFNHPITLGDGLSETETLDSSH